MEVDLEKCIGCGYCVRDCPVGAVRLKEKKAVIDHHACTHCKVCFRVCEQEALTVAPVMPAEAVECDACPIKCWIQPGFEGACRRYLNREGRLVRTTPVLAYKAVADIVGSDPPQAIRRPLITAIGSGTTYPDCKPAPRIVKGEQHGVDVVTVVTEVPLSYSSIIVKIDTDVPLGREGDRVLVGKREVGMVETEQYGSKMLHIGGVNRLTGPNGFLVARTITRIANRERVKLKIENGRRLEIQVGHPPIIDGQEVASMRVGCGSATMGLFAPLLKEAADEAIILDSHITGQMSRHVAGQFVGARPSGVQLVFKESTPGRCFGDHGDGWGGTSIIRPADVIAHIDMTVARPGMTILITETTGQNAVLYQVTVKGELAEIPLTQKARTAVEALAASCEPSRVSAVYTGGAGGSARAGVVKSPIKLTRAVHAGQAQLSVGGAPGFIWPGGGISFMVDVEKVKSGSFYWTPTPATICPLEYTMTEEDYRAIGGHVEAIKPFEAQLPDDDEPSA
ncbi:MAG: 4Fe-4S binding protein [Desulfobacterales bacterium]